jgi:hypothetical protein
MARASKVAAKPKKKTVRATRIGANRLPLMPNKITWEGAKYYTHYEVESKEWLERVKIYIKNNYDKKLVSAINKLPDWKIGGNSHWACTAYCLENIPTIVPEDYKNGIHKWILELAEEGAAVAEEKKKEEKTKKNVYVPTIQERIRDQSQDMVTDIDEWLEGWIQDPSTFDPKGFDFKAHFAKLQPSQAHARKMKTFYDGVLADYDDLERMPTAGQLKKMDEREADLWQQLKEGYAHLKKADIKKFRTAIEELMAALDFIIDSAKANRKPRKAKPKSATKLVEKLKFSKTDEKYKLASIDPTLIVGANELWVFNVKTRKLGKYVAANIDPKGMGRDGTGLSVKGTTIIGFDENLSIQKTVRKPDDVLKEFKAAGKVKLRKFLDEINSVDTKLNGRCNPDTVLLKVS